jgi:hypothetical protein
MEAVPDAALLASFFAGEAGALEELARRYEGPLLGLAMGLLDGTGTWPPMRFRKPGSG